MYKVETWRVDDEDCWQHKRTHTHVCVCVLRLKHQVVLQLGVAAPLVLQLGVAAPLVLQFQIRCCSLAVGAHSTATCRRRRYIPRDLAFDRWGFIVCPIVRY